MLDYGAEWKVVPKTNYIGADGKDRVILVAGEPMCPLQDHLPGCDEGKAVAAVGSLGALTNSMGQTPWLVPRVQSRTLRHWRGNHRANWGAATNREADAIQSRRHGGGPMLSSDNDRLLDGRETRRVVCKRLSS